MNTSVAKAENPFGAVNVAQASGGALIETESQRAIQEVQASMVIAKKFPRDPIEAMDRILNACTRPTLAASALYSYPRGGQEVTGPSIRLAEALAQEWGNMQFGVRELSQSRGESTVEAFAWDVQTNTRQVKVFQVPHVRYTRAAGNKPLTDPRDIYEVVANQGARRLRACILGVIPGDVVEAAVNQCEVTQNANVDSSPEGIKKVLEKFEPYGVSQSMIEERISKRAEAIQPAQILQLKKIYQSLRDGMSKPEDWFAVKPSNKEAEQAQKSLNQTSKIKQATVDTDTGEITESAEKAAVETAKPEEKRKVVKNPGNTIANDKLNSLIGMASNQNDLDAIVAMDDWEELAEGEAVNLQASIQNKRDEFTDPA